jgi:hypothetical protein
LQPGQNVAEIHNSLLVSKSVNQSSFDENLWLPHANSEI